MSNLEVGDIFLGHGREIWRKKRRHTYEPQRIVLLILFRDNHTRREVLNVTLRA